MKKLIPFLLIILIAGCTQTAQQRSFLKGVAGFVPANYPNPSEQDWQDFFAELPEAGEVFGDYVSWTDTAQIPLTMQITSQNNMIPVIAVGFNIEEVNDTYFTINKLAMQEAILNITRTYDVKYMGIGVEINRLIYLASNESFNDFITFYTETYDLIKEESPDTKIFPIFQLEMIKGKAKLTGINNLHEDWYIIKSFENKSDLTGFTTYPFLEYDNAEEIPDNYYNEIGNYTDKPIIFTEIGWPSNLTLINTSEEEQLKFMQKFINSTKDLNKEIIIYSFLHDGEFNPSIFNTIGLKHNNDTTKPIYEYWKTI